MIAVSSNKRDEQQHKRACELLNGLLQPPVSNLRTVLDVGCGLGAWSRDVALHYPHTQVIGIDANERVVQQAREIAAAQDLPNVSFRSMDVTQPLGLDGQTFDLIFARYLFLHLPRAVWQPVVTSLAGHLQPNGYIQLVDGGLEKASTPAWNELLHTFSQLMKVRRHDANVSLSFSQLLVDADLQLYSCTYHPLLSGVWSIANFSPLDALGRFNKARALIELPSLISLEHYDTLLQQARREIELPAFMAAGSVISAIGQRV